MKTYIQEPAINDILKAIQKLASGDYSRKAEIGGGNDLMDALATGINMLGEELEAAHIENERKNNELEKTSSELAIEKYKYEALTENAPIGIFRRLPGIGAKFVEANPALFRIFGFSNKEEFLAKDPDDLWWDPAESTVYLKKLEDQSFAVENEAAMRRMNNDRIFCHISTMAVKDKEGKVQFYDGVISEITQQKQILENLEYESSLIGALLQHSQDFIYFKDLESRFIRVSKSKAIKNGFSSSLEMEGKSDHDLFSHKDAERRFKDEQKIIKTRKPIIGIEEKEIGSDGKEKWMRTSKIPWMNEHDEIIGTFGISHDITFSKLHEIELKASEEKFRTLIHNMGEGVGIVDDQERFLFANPAAEKIFGVKQGMMIGRNLKDFILPEVIEKISMETGRRKKGETNTYDLSIIRPDKESRKILVTAAPNYNEESRSVNVIGIFRDVTEDSRLRQEISEHKEFLDNITGAAQEAIVVIDHRGRVTFWNLSAEVLFGYKKKEIMGRNFHDIMVPAEYHDAHRKGFAKFLKAGTGAAIGKTLELFALHKNGNKFPVELSLSAMKIHDRWNAVGIIKDITERRIIENRLSKAKEQAEQANRAKSEFLANISHEIRTPMNAILGFSEILENQVAADPEIRDYITGIKNSGKGLLSLINDILDLSKIEAGKLEINRTAVNPLDLIHEIRQIFALKTKEKGLSFEINIDETLPSGLILDETRIRQILFNLIGNAIKFTSSGGIIVNVKSPAEGDEGSHISLVFEIIDTGIGIPETEVKRVFEPFKQAEGQSTRKYGGTGLGLSITQRLVDMMVGTITVESTVNEGSKFSVRFPGIEIAAMTDDQKNLHSRNSNIQFQNAHILHIEDVESNRQVVRGYLKTHQIKITEAENGKTGIEQARKVKPDLILMDIQMPEMDGYEATRILKSDPEVRDIPVIILTASTMKEDLDKFRNICNGYLRKPVSLADLVNELSKHLPHVSGDPGLKSPAETRENFIELTRDEIGDKGIGPKLHLCFRDKIMPDYEAILKNKSNQGLINFASLITKTGLEYKIGSLEKYGEVLSHYIRTLNVKQIDRMLLDFKGISEVLLTG